MTSTHLLNRFLVFSPAHTEDEANHEVNLTIRMNTTVAL